MNEKSTTSAWFWCLFLSTQYHGAFAKLLVAIFCHWWTYWMKSKPCWTGLSEFLRLTSTLERLEFCFWCAPYPSLVQKSCWETVAVFDMTKMLESTNLHTKTCFQHPQSKPLLPWMVQHLFSGKTLPWHFKPYMCVYIYIYISVDLQKFLQHQHTIYIYIYIFACLLIKLANQNY